MRGSKGESWSSEMNRRVYLSSFGQQHLVMGGFPSWWSMSNLKASNEVSPLFNFPPSSSFAQPHEPSNSSPANPTWYENYDLQQAWMSQLLLGGLATQEERCSLISGPFQAQNIQDWENQLIFRSQGDQVAVLKPEASESSGNAVSHISSCPWRQIPPVSPKACDASGFSSNMLNFSNYKSEGKHRLPDQSAECNSNETSGAFKKARVQASLHQSSTFKVKKEKLGDRVTALHQLVSPFGKTDTASVLLEAIGYIRFLHSQIGALSSPYLAAGSGSTMQSVREEKNYTYLEHPSQGGTSEQKNDLSSRGLCLVPLSCTMYVESSNGADYWAPSISGGF